jgi:ATP-binding cassette subfamily G (WHITE) protein 2
MCKGRSVYHGQTDGIIPYLGTLGHQCELYDNPADFALDVLIDASQTSETLEKLYSAYEKSDMYATMSVLAKPKMTESNRNYRPDGEAARSFGTEVFYVAQRTLRNAVRDPSLFVSQIIVAIVIGLLVGLVFFDMKRTTDPGVQNRLGAIFFMIVSQVFSTVTALEPLLKERTLFIHVSFHNEKR